MKKAIIWTWFAVLTSSIVTAQTLPVITSSPANVTVSPGNTATFTVVTTGATSYQWICNGTNIAGATSATLQVTNAQTANCGYYLALAKNSTGWMPSQMAYLTLDYTHGGTQPTACGTLPFSNTNDTYFAGAADQGLGVTNGTVQIVAGPELDEMKPVGLLLHYNRPIYTFLNGYYNAPDQSDPTIMPGQVVYYGTIVNFTNNGYPDTWPSTIMNLAAGTNGTAAPTSYGLKFPGWFPTEGVEPLLGFETPTNQMRVAGETFSLTNEYFVYTDYGIPTVQWRKNGIPIPNATNSFGFSQPSPAGYITGALSVTNVQSSDAGIYDMIIYGNEWIAGPKIIVSVQTTNGQGVFLQPKIAGTNLICNLIGAAGRGYQVQWSTNLTTWNNLVTLTNVSGTIAFTNPAPQGSQFYRTLLLP